MQVTTSFTPLNCINVREINSCVFQGLDKKLQSFLRVGDNCESLFHGLNIIHKSIVFFFGGLYYSNWYKRNDTYVEIYMVDHQAPVPQLFPPIESS